MNRQWAESDQTCSRIPHRLSIRTAGQPEGSTKMDTTLIIRIVAGIAAVIIAAIIIFRRKRAA
jgi:hypothetical protein